MALHWFIKANGYIGELVAMTDYSGNVMREYAPERAHVVYAILNDGPAYVVQIATNIEHEDGSVENVRQNFEADNLVNAVAFAENDATPEPLIPAAQRDTCPPF